jgi:hypothetical protein
MIYKRIENNDFDKAMEIAWYANKNEYYEAKDMFGLFPNQFIGSYDKNKMTGFCFGWPIYIQRDKNTIFMLKTISIIEELRKMGIGTELMKYWENEVWKEYSLPIGLGSTADGFYLRNGYNFIEHCIKTDIENYRAVESKINKYVNRIEYASFPMVSVLIKNNGKYNSELYREMIQMLKSENYCSFFEKSKR